MSGIVDKRYQDHMRAAVYKAERNQARQDVELLQRKVERLEDHIEKLKVELAAAKSLLRGPSVPRAAYDRQHERLLGHIRECETALGKRNAQIKNMGRHIDSLYKMLRDANDADDAAAWVRDHGGLNVVKNLHDNGELPLCDLCEILGLDRVNTSWMDAFRELEKRLMPEGMEWPRFEDGEFVRSGDRLIDDNGDWFSAVSFIFTCDWWCIEGYHQIGFGTLSRETKRKLSGMPPGERVKRPAPKVLDADGVEIRVGDEVWSIEGGFRYIVTEVTKGSDGKDLIHARYYDPDILTCDLESTTYYLRPYQLTHRAPVLAADGKPLSEGERVWHVETGAELVVKELPKPGEYQAVVVFAPPASHFMSFDPDQLTHDRHDSWERLEEDALLDADEYSNLYGIEGNDDMNWMKAVRADIVRRAKALAERGQ